MSNNRNKRQQRRPGGSARPAAAPKKPTVEATVAAPPQRKGYTPPKSRPTKARPTPTRQRKAPLWALVAIVVAIVGGVVGIAVITSGGEEGITDAAAWDLPALSDTGDPDGDGRLTLAEYRGTPVVVNFFASWCTSCETELPRFDAAADIAAGEVEFVFVNSNETGNWRPMTERTGVDDRVLMKDINGSNGNGLYRSLGGSGGMPMTAFYDADGNLLQVDLGELSSDIIAQRLDTLFSVDIRA